MTHQPDFSGCWAKVGRANVHLSFLDERIDSFINESNLYEFDTLDDRRRETLTARLSVD